MVGFNAEIRTDLVSASADVSGFGYHAAEDKGRRRAPPSSLESEDRTLGVTGRKRVTSGGRDVIRNFTIAAWMVRKHVDYVCEASFHARTGDDGFDTECENLIKWWSGRYNFDIGGRFGCDKYIRLAETRGLAEGDFGTLKLGTGHVQGIEGDRIRQPEHTRLNAEDDSWEWIEGVKTAALGGRALAYAIHRRGRGGRGFKFEKDVAASNLYLHGFFDRYDQTRGISPLTAAINNLKDVYENFDLALAKAKISQLLALVIERDGTGDEDEADGQAATKRGDDGYEIDFGMGPIKLGPRNAKLCSFTDAAFSSASRARVPRGLHNLIGSGAHCPAFSTCKVQMCRRCRNGVGASSLAGQNGAGEEQKRLTTNGRSSRTVVPLTGLPRAERNTKAERMRPRANNLVARGRRLFCKSPAPCPTAKARREHPSRAGLAF